MNRKLFSEKSGEIYYEDVLPANLAHYQIHDEPYYSACWEGGDILEQEMNGEVRIRYSNYLLQEEDRLRIVEDRPVLALQFILTNSFYGDWTGLGRRIDHEASFNLFYMPRLEQTLEGKGSRAYRKVEIQYSAEQLRSIAEHYPMLEKLLRRAEQGQPTLLHTNNQIATSQMYDGVEMLLHNNFSSGARRLYEEAKGVGLLLMALEFFDRNKQPAPPLRLSPYEVEQIYQAKEYMLNRISMPPTLAEIATAVGANKFQLNNGFQEVYGVTVFDFFLNARMDQAKYFLLETDETIETIAWVLGYNDVSSFSRAFKKYYGPSPRYYRAQPLLSRLKYRSSKS